MIHSLFSFAAAVAVLAAAPPATGSTDKHVTVRHADLDLSTAKGLARLDRRIAVAIENVCGSYAGARVDEEIAIAACRKTARQQIVAQRAAALRQGRVASR